MDRFAFKIDKTLKANLYKICRLCGIDRIEKIPIKNDADLGNLDDEPILEQKIKVCIGFIIQRDDKMPQTICTLCVDKINDFYEFREMCFATDAQTRILLGLKDTKPLGISFGYQTSADEVKVETFKPNIKQGRKRKSCDINVNNFKVPKKFDCLEIKNEDSNLYNGSAPTRKKVKLSANRRIPDQPAKQVKGSVKFKNEIKDEILDVTTTSAASNVTITRPKFKHLCDICKDGFKSKAQLERHLNTSHIPNIKRYYCNTCDETLKKSNDIKDHQLWHKLSKTPFTCGHCNEQIPTFYAYSKHLRDHNQKWLTSTSTSTLVLDRQCPQCNEIFATNFLYNIHFCSIQTKKCAGCSRQLRNEQEYIRHAAVCPQTYSNYSHHIKAAAVVAESCVRIKNENDVEAEAAENMAPVVLLTRLEKDNLLSTACQNSVQLHNDDSRSSKKLSKKNLTKRNIKRVDELLKSTIDVLVSIKHEPEMHMDTDIPVGDDMEGNLSTKYRTNCSVDKSEDLDKTDAHHCDGAGLVSIKKEFVDESYHNDLFNNVPLNIKKEPSEGVMDESVQTKVPIIKIKIKKEHGQLNSSLVAESAPNEKKKKKKKRKNEKSRNKTLDKESDQITQLQEINKDRSQHWNVYIKKEIVEEHSQFNNNNLSENITIPDQQQPESTVMTSIPFMQFEISCISSGVDFVPNDINSHNEEQDIKPDPEILERMLKITNVSSDDPTDKEATTEQYKINEKTFCNKEINTNTDDIDKITTSLSKNLKKTNPNLTSKAGEKDLQVAITDSGADVCNVVNEPAEQRKKTFFMENITIKTEPIDYNPNPLEDTYDVSHNSANKYNELSNIDGFDFSKIKVKQEVDIDVSETQISKTTFLKTPGLRSSLNDEESDDSNETSDFEHETCMDSDLEEREYRELELPPLFIGQEKSNEKESESFSKSLPNVEEEHDKCSTTTSLAVENIRSSPHFHILNVFSQTSELHNIEENSNSLNINENKLETEIINRKSLCQLKITAVTAGCSNSFYSENYEFEHQNISMENLQADTESEVMNLDPVININKNASSEAVPFFVQRFDGTVENNTLRITDFVTNLNSSATEEHQNFLNQEMLLQQEQLSLNTPSISNLNSNVISENRIVSECSPKSVNNEETENLFNEHAYDILQSHSEDQQPHRQEEEEEEEQINSSNIIAIQQLLMNDDTSNVNEIAENNNNANIERERDDSTAASEAVALTVEERGGISHSETTVNESIIGKNL